MLQMRIMSVTINRLKKKNIISFSELEIDYERCELFLRQINKLSKQWTYYALMEE